MQENTAKKIVDQLDIVGRELSRLLNFIYEISQEEQKKKFKIHIYDMFDIMNVAILAPTIKQYPDLDPDKEYFEQKKKRKALAAEHKSLIPLEKNNANEIYKLAQSMGKDLFSMLNHIQENYIEYNDIKKGIENCDAKIQRDIVSILRERYPDIDDRTKWE